MLFPRPGNDDSVAPSSGKRGPNHWTTREVPVFLITQLYFSLFDLSILGCFYLFSIVEDNGQLSLPPPYTQSQPSSHQFLHPLKR